MTTNDITRYDFCLINNFMEFDDEGAYVTYEDHVEAVAKAVSDAHNNAWVNVRDDAWDKYKGKYQ